MPSLIPLIDISEYHADIEASLRLYYLNSNPSYQTRFTGYFPSEVLTELNERLSETERRSALVILARVEAAFRVDYKTRAASKNSDPISVRFRRLYAQKGNKVRFEGDILEIWRQYLDPADRVIIGQLREMLKYRHWLAHGRYWNSGIQHTFGDVYLLADGILTVFEFQGR